MEVQRVTESLRKVLAVLPADRRVSCYGYEIMEATGLHSSTVYRILARLERQGWVQGAWQYEGQPGPRRRVYQLTEAGTKAAKEILE